MLINIAETPIHNNALSTQVFGSRAHQPAPASRVKTFGLRDEDNAILLDAIGKVPGRFRSCRIVGVDHLDGIRGPEDFGFACLLEGREHFEAVKVAAVGDFQFYEGVADLDMLLERGMKIKVVVEYGTSQLEKALSELKALVVAMICLYD